MGSVRELFSLRVDKSVPRVGLASVAFAVLFLAIGARLVMLAATTGNESAVRRAASSGISAARPDILDRNGEVLATDVKTVSVFAEPRNIVDKDEAVELLTAGLPRPHATEVRHQPGAEKGLALGQGGRTPPAHAGGYPCCHPGGAVFPQTT